MFGPVGRRHSPLAPPPLALAPALAVTDTFDPFVT